MSNPPHWPFETAEEFSEWKSLSDQSYAALWEAHEQWMQAFDKRVRPMDPILRSYDDERLRDLAVELTRQAADEQSRAAQTQRQATQVWEEVKRRRRGANES